MTTQTTTTAMTAAIVANDFDSVRTILFTGSEAAKADQVSKTELSQWILSNDGIDFEQVGAVSDLSDRVKARLVSVWGVVERSDSAESVYKSFNTVLQRTAKDNGLKVSITRARNAKKAGAKFEFTDVAVEVVDYDAKKAESAAKREADKAAEINAAVEQRLEEMGINPDADIKPIAKMSQAELLHVFALILEKATKRTESKMAAIMASRLAGASDIDHDAKEVA